MQRWLATISAVAVLFGGVFALWFWWYQKGVHLVAKEIQNPEVLGQVGDLFGGINALFAAFAFSGVAVAAFFQHQTWRLQAEQAELAREQAELARDQHSRQSFEPLFFKLLDRVGRPTLLKPDDELDVKCYYGDEADFNLLVQAVRRWIAENPAYAAALHSNEPFAHGDIVPQYETIYYLNQRTLGPYYRALYQVFKLIYFSGLSEKAKVQYANIVRSTLSSDELLFLALNCLTEHGRNFRYLVEEYGLLKHVSQDAEEFTVDQLIVRTFYEPTAYLSHRGRLQHWEKHPEDRQQLNADLASI